MKLDRRKEIILASVFENFALSGEPVGSKNIQKLSNLGVSSATIRSEMSQLEALGYLEQIHKSSGRVPSIRGYRYYIDEIMKPYTLDIETNKMIENEISLSQSHGMDKLMKNSTELLSNLTGLTCISYKSSDSETIIRNIKLIEVDNMTILLVILTQSGIVQNSIIKLKDKLTNDEINYYNNFLEKHFRNKSVESVLSVLNDKIFNLKNHYSFVEVMNAMGKCIDDSKKEIFFLKGITNLIKNSEDNNSKEVKELVDFIENKENLKRLFSSFENSCMKIGDENSEKAMKNFAVLTKLYSEDLNYVRIAIIGPKIIPYNKIMALLSKVASEINNVLLSGE